MYFVMVYSIRKYKQLLQDLDLFSITLLRGIEGKLFKTIVYCVIVFTKCGKSQWFIADFNVLQ